MSTTLPETQPLSPTMRHTLELVKWAAEGFANAHRIRCARIAGAPEFSGAEAMEMYLKSQGIDLPRLDKVVRGLMEDGNAAAAIKEVADVVSEAAVRSPKDLSELVQRLAHAATGREPQPGTTTAPPGRPLIRPEYLRAAGTSPSGGKPRFRPEYTSAARRGGVTAHEPCVPDPPPAAANEAPRVDPSVCVDATSSSSTVASSTSCACTDPPSGSAPTSSTGTDRPTQTEAHVAGASVPAADDEAQSRRLDTLERRLDALEADLAREIAALRQWTTEQLRVLSERIAASTAASESLKQEHEALKQRVQQLEAALASRDEGRAKKLAEEACATSTDEQPASAPAEPAEATAAPLVTPAEAAQAAPLATPVEAAPPPATPAEAAPTQAPPLATPAEAAPAQVPPQAAPPQVPTLATPAEVAPAQVPPLATPAETLSATCDAEPAQEERAQEETSAGGCPTGEEEPRPAGQEHALTDGSPSPTESAACPTDQGERVAQLEQRMDRYENEKRSAVSLQQEATHKIAELHRKLPAEQGEPLS